MYFFIHYFNRYLLTPSIVLYNCKHYFILRFHLIVLTILWGIHGRLVLFLLEKRTRFREIEFNNYHRANSVKSWN